MQVKSWRETLATAMLALFALFLFQLASDARASRPLFQWSLAHLAATSA